jgi:hypothetical protein
MQALLSRHIQRIELDSTERRRPRRLRTSANIVLALVPLMAIPLSAFQDIR